MGLTVLGTLFVGLLVSLLGRVMYAEFEARLPKITAFLIERAVRRLPKHHQESLREEWHAVIEDTPGVILKMVRSFGFHRAAIAVGEHERNIERQLTWPAFAYLVGVLAGAAVIWTMKQVEDRSKRHLPFGWKGAILGFMCKRQESYALALLEVSDALRDFGNDERSRALKEEGEHLANTCIDNVVDVAMIHALNEMIEDGRLS